MNGESLTEAIVAILPEDFQDLTYFRKELRSRGKKPTATQIYMELSILENEGKVISEPSECKRTLSIRKYKICKKI